MLHKIPMQLKLLYSYATSVDALAALASAALISGNNLLRGKPLDDKLCPFRVKKYVNI